MKRPAPAASDAEAPATDSRVAGFSCPMPHGTPDQILLAHGSGGRLTAQLIEELVVPAFRNPELERLDDQAVLPVEGGARIAFTTDSYVVTPIFFPGGDIGELAVNGTVNDLAVGGAKPIGLSVAFILEEGLPLEDLRRVIDSARRAAHRAGVPIVTGDTKVVGRGSADQIFINTSGVGVVPSQVRLGPERVRPGDVVLVSGTLGDHGVAILTLREGLELEGRLQSDTAALNGLCRAVLDVAPDTHAMRDPTRGGLAATLTEVARSSRLGIDIDEDALPIRDEVRGACELLGLDPMLVANEGKAAVFVPEARAAAALDAMRAHPLGRNAACIGRVTDDHPGSVVVETAIGGERILDLPYAEPLPRIC